MWSWKPSIIGIANSERKSNLTEVKEPYYAMIIPIVAVSSFIAALYAFSARRNTLGFGASGFVKAKAEELFV
jgi:hypothetical protein